MITQNDTKWTSRQVKYMQILADPDDHRIDEEIAKSLGVARKTLYLWRQNPKFLDASYDILLKEVGGKLNEIFSGLIRKAKSGDPQATRLILETLQKLKQPGVNIEKAIIVQPILGGQSVQPDNSVTQNTAT